eukprot:COSAG06_NODE_1602_length_8958_cov_85.920194_4_plen_50_part_00
MMGSMPLGSRQMISKRRSRRHSSAAVAAVAELWHRRQGGRLCSRSAYRV